MRFSVIVPIYKVEPYLRQCLDSIVSQDYTDFELILVDDGSPDECPSICDEYAEKDSRITVIHKENGGLVSARKAGISVAKGDFIIGVDSDDWLSQGYFTKASEIIDEYNPDLISFAITFCEINNERYSKEPFGQGFYSKEEKDKNILPKVILTPDMQHAHYFVYGKVYRREIAYKYQMAVSNSINMGEDVCMSVPVCINADSVYISDDSVYNVRTLNTSMSRKFNPNHFAEIKAVSDYLVEVADGNSVLLEQAYRYFVFLTFVLLCSAAEQSEKSGIARLSDIWDASCQSYADKAEFKDITVKSDRAVKLIKKGKFKAAYRFLRICSLLKGGQL